MENMGIAEGMEVRGQDGKKLGKVIECAADGFVVEKGLFFPKDFHVRYDQVADVRDGEVYLDQARLGVVEGAGPAYGQGDTAAAGAPRPVEASPAMAEARDELRVPLAAEELEAEKRQRQAGEVRVHKEVVTENREVAVPVTREEVRVERVPVEGNRPAGDAAFQEGTVSVPVREEEVEIRKRPVVKEEVRVNRSRRQEERRAEVEVRREEARIDEQGELERGGAESPEGLPRAGDPER